ALVASSVSPASLQAWADVGQAFGAISAVIASAALVAVIVTFYAQQSEMRSQRAELKSQSATLARSGKELQCSSETGLSMFHLNLVKLSIENPHLAEVWPANDPTLQDNVNQQFLYCTLILEGVWLNARTGRYKEADVRANVRYLFTSPVFRQYWRATRSKRALAVATEGPESWFFEVVDEIYEESG